MNNSDVLISVIVPVYNAARYLPRCMDSILTQTHRRLEVILINDGSTDESGAVCDDYAARDKRVTVLHQENGGVSSARNAGLDKAKGDYIGFVDSDDEAMPELFEKLLGAIKKHNKQIAVCGHVRFHVEGPVETRKQIEIPKNLSVEDALEYLLSNKHYEGFLWNKLFDNRLINENGKLRFDADLYNCGDLYFVNQCFLKSKGIAYIPEALYHYRLFDEGLTRMYTLKRHTELLAWERIIKINENQSSRINELARFRYFEAAVNLYRMAALSKNSEQAGFYKTASLAQFNKCLLIKGMPRKDKLRLVIILLFPKASTKIWRLMKNRFNIIWHSRGDR